MPTSFDVFYLGNAASIDPSGGGSLAQDAAALEKAIAGNGALPLFRRQYEFTSGEDAAAAPGFISQRANGGQGNGGKGNGGQGNGGQNNGGQGNGNDLPDIFDLAQGGDHFCINGGDHGFDAAAVYHATATYIDGTVVETSQ